MPSSRIRHGPIPAGRGRPIRRQRPPYQGSTPYNDIGSIAAIRLGGKYLVRAVRDAGDKEARHQLMFASTLAGLAFGSAGVHIPHAMSYSVATSSTSSPPRATKSAIRWSRTVSRW